MAKKNILDGENLVWTLRSGKIAFDTPFLLPYTGRNLHKILKNNVISDCVTTFCWIVHQIKVKIMFENTLHVDH